jgi:hypothetical protein
MYLLSQDNIHIYCVERAFMQYLNRKDLEAIVRTHEQYLLMIAEFKCHMQASFRRKLADIGSECEIIPCYHVRVNESLNKN